MKAFITPTGQISAISNFEFERTVRNGAMFLMKQLPGQFTLEQCKEAVREKLSARLISEGYLTTGDGFELAPTSEEIEG